MKDRNKLRFLAVLLVLVVALGLVFVRQQPKHILLSNATASPIEGVAGTVGVFLKIENAGGPDRLISATSKKARQVEVDGAKGSLAIPALSSPGLAPDGVFLRLVDVTGDIADGRTLPVTLKFEMAGEMSVRARVVAPTTPGDASGFGLFGIGDICQVGEGEPAPQISLNVEPERDGWRVDVVSSQFEFTPDLVDGPHVPGTGHGHLYLNGLKLQRLYAPTARIEQLPAGTHDITVTLNTNDHRAYVLGDDPVTASTTLTVD